MSICAISCSRIASRILYGRILATSSASTNSLFAFRLTNSCGTGRRTLSIDANDTDPLVAIVKEQFQAFPIVHDFDRWIQQSRNYMENLVENYGLSNTPLEQLGLYTWWKLSSWYRIVLESLHTNHDLPWLVTIICGTLFIRLVTYYMPALMVWKRTRSEDPERPFLQRIRSKLGSAILYSSVPGLFLTQYCGIKKMAEVVYPGWTNAGVLWFTDLTLPDPYFVLPIVTAICFTVTSMKWIETLQIQKTVSRWIFDLNSNNAVYPIAACSFFVASNVPSAICIYWITSSLISGIHATILSRQSVRTQLCLPSIYQDPAKLHQAELLSYINDMRRRRAVQMLEEQRKTTQIAAETEKLRELSGISRAQEMEASLELERDSLFREPWIIEGASSSSSSLSRSKVQELMEQRKQEAARADAEAKANKPKPVIRTVDNQKIEIAKITVGES